jgi:outer membrane biosynthesis protein TonB
LTGTDINLGIKPNIDPKAPLPIWELPPRGDFYLNFRISRNTLIAVIVSLLIHALLILFVLKAVPNALNPPTAPPEQSPIVVQLGQPKKQPPAEIAPPNEVTPELNPVIVPRKQRTPPKPRPVPPTPPVIATQKPAPSSAAQPTTPAPTDMQSYVNAMRAKRLANQSPEETAAAAENAASMATERGPTDEEKRDAIIKKNLQPQGGGGGVFQITSKGTYNAQFSFNGWKKNSLIAEHQVINVEADRGEDINRAIVKKMILIIRKDYPGDFTWESVRLGRTITKSARIEDNDELEDFLMKEFFGGGGKSFN